MSLASLAIGHIGFLIPGNYAEERPAEGLEDTLSLFARAEALGYDSAWVRQRHLETGISSASTFLAAATQRTRRIGLGVAVIHMGYENPMRLAEDLATVDVLGNGRLNVGLSAGEPSPAALLGARFNDNAAADSQSGYGRIAELAANLAGGWIGEEDAVIVSAGGRQKPRVRPHAQGLRDRLWYGAGSLRSAAWAGTSGFNLLVGNINVTEGAGSFQAVQQAQIEAYWNSYAGQAAPRVSAGRVILPLDSANARTRRKYQDFAASRHERTLSPQGERRTQFAPDIVGSAEQILEALNRDPVLRHVAELRLELPYNFARGEYEQILSDFIGLVAPEIGHRRH
ncbi:alkanesulfonate monooxygenase SsuD/methylene tetrahydromethanopterin reductase-like flavin-dependent oxidoreductase (luciferase family) [Bosea sp. BE125]|uniref:LLM class flavin-dependent oxidoreductase n=1 Tax=Bosea sp. BE125 TaxID=2817909 RepID=UPI002866DA16|nr:LLM class flavin-dependent oxidoreductase [Bosea sp. BE125]MDR6871736.1 alkanesulfonate monooxygenase SsuD/methylene tetrahydromethanopterin reductase-like flavin-dependent oxidoreductase (luciferase family) [Bosea sp. BE125]